MRRAICDMTQAVKQLKSAKSSRSDLQNNLTKMRQLRESLLIVSHTVYTRSRPPELFTSTQAEHQRFSSEFTAFLSALVPQLERLGSKLNNKTACSIGTAEEDMFWELWNFLTSSCSSFATAHAMSQNLWPAGEKPFYHSQFAAFHSLLAWLLSISRSSAWLLMTPANGSHHRNRELVVILMQPTRCLESVGQASPAKFQALLGVIPPPFIPLLCCIVTEQLCIHVPPLVPQQPPAEGSVATTYTPDPSNACFYHAFPFYAYLETLAVVLNNLYISDKNTRVGNSSHSTLSPSASVIQLCKALIILPGETPCTTPELVVCSVECLHRLLCATSQQAIGCGSEALSQNPVYVTNRDPVGLPLHLNPCVSSPALDTDVKLFQAIARHMSCNPVLTCACYEIHMLILDNWRYACMYTTITTHGMCEMLQGVVGLAHQCVSVGLRLIMQLQQGQLGQQQEQPRQQQGAAGDVLSSAELAVWQTQGMSSVRQLMYLISSFQLKTPDGRIHTKSSELNGW